jgi:hypothetical protein
LEPEATHLGREPEAAPTRAKLAPSRITPSGSGDVFATAGIITATAVVTAIVVASASYYSVDDADA